MLIADGGDLNPKMVAPRGRPTWSGPRKAPRPGLRPLARPRGAARRATSPAKAAGWSPGWREARPGGRSTRSSRGRWPSSRPRRWPRPPGSYGRAAQRGRGDLAGATPAAPR